MLAVATQSSISYEQALARIAQLEETITEERHARQKAERKVEVIITKTRQIFSATGCSYADRIMKAEHFLADPDGVLEGKGGHLDIDAFRKRLGIGHNTAAIYFEAMQQSGGMVYTCETVKNAEGQWRNRSFSQPDPEKFFTCATNTTPAKAKQRTAEKKSQEKSLEKLKKSMLVCPQCHSEEHMHVGIIPICSSCGYQGTIEGGDIDVVKSADVRIVVGGDETETTTETEHEQEQSSVSPLVTPSDMTPPDDDAYYGAVEIDIDSLQPPAELDDIPLPDESSAPDETYEDEYVPPFVTGKSPTKQSPRQKRNQVTPIAIRTPACPVCHARQKVRQIGADGNQFKCDGCSYPFYMSEEGGGR